MQIVTPYFYNYTVVSRIGTNPIMALEFATHMKIDPEIVEGETLLYINSLIDSAVAFAEKYTKRYLISSNIKAYLDYFMCSGDYELRVAQLTSITSLKYYSDGSLSTIDSSNYYKTNSQRFCRLSPIENYSWPDSDSRLQSVEIELIGGYTSSDFPPDLKLALLCHVAAMYSNRGDCAVDNSACSLPVSVRNVYNAFKIKEVVFGV